MPTDYDLLRRLAERDLLARDSHPASRTGPSAAPTRRRDSLPSTRPDPFSIDGAGLRQTRAGAERAMGGDPDVINRPGILPAVSQQGDVVAPEALYGILRSLAGLSSGDFNAEDAITLAGSAAGATLPGARVAPGTVSSFFVNPRHELYDWDRGQRAWDRIQSDIEYLRTEEGTDRLWRLDQTFPSMDRELLQEIDTNHWRIDPKFTAPKGTWNGVRAPLADVLQNAEPELERFPQLGEIELSLFRREPRASQVHGESLHNEGEAPQIRLFLPNNKPLDNYWMGVLDHELDHLASRRGGRGRGGSERTGSDMRYRWGLERDRLQAALAKLQPKSPEAKSLAQELKRVQDLANLDAHSHYESLLSEVEARLGQYRRTQSPEHRQAFSPATDLPAVMTSKYVQLNPYKQQVIAKDWPSVFPPGTPYQRPQTEFDRLFEYADPLTDDLQAVLASMRRPR